MNEDLSQLLASLPAQEDAVPARRRFRTVELCERFPRSIEGIAEPLPALPLASFALTFQQHSRADAVRR